MQKAENIYQTSNFPNSSHFNSYVVSQSLLTVKYSSEPKDSLLSAVIPLTYTHSRDMLTAFLNSYGPIHHFCVVF